MINILNKLIMNQDLKRSVFLTFALVLALMAFFFYSESDIPFVYSQF